MTHIKTVSMVDATYLSASAAAVAADQHDRDGIWVANGVGSFA